MTSNTSIDQSKVLNTKSITAFGTQLCTNSIYDSISKNRNLSWPRIIANGCQRFNGPRMKVATDLSQLSYWSITIRDTTACHQCLQHCWFHQINIYFNSQNAFCLGFKSQVVNCKGLSAFNHTSSGLQIQEMENGKNANRTTRAHITKSIFQACKRIICS